MVFINSLDDPVVPAELLEVVRDASLNNPNMIFVEQKFGGHLGFYEGGFFYSNPLTWQDRSASTSLIPIAMSSSVTAILSRMVIHIANALVADEGKPNIETWEESKAEEGTDLALGVTVHRSVPSIPAS